ncbi:MAG: hypothetical protein Harvfovirus5_2 [Harvfovirus sp.]|uniref:Uncharacterized protein n=1 Tax=Harvfovirus sp. TaxID=2487768 RepID=A0A3G5A0I6_9VIRU|nr:MAG: hypothetical protein Harvfovirus5_2 [Harvfovirus sp.]
MAAASEPLVDQQIKILQNYDDIINKIKDDHKINTDRRQKGAQEITTAFDNLVSQIQKDESLNAGLKQTKIDTLSEARNQRSNLLGQWDVDFLKLTRRLWTYGGSIYYALDDAKKINREALASIAKIPRDVLPAENVANRLKSIEAERILRLEQLGLTDKITKLTRSIPIYQEEERILSKRLDELLMGLTGGGGKYYAKYMKYKTKYITFKNLIL